LLPRLSQPLIKHDVKGYLPAVYEPSVQLVLGAILESESLSTKH
jgi:hypothetical protein